MTDAKFWAKVKKFEEPDGCWEWQGALNNGGYGLVRRLGGLIVTHRYAYYLHHGELPKNLACHKCDNRKCVRPDHLFDGTYADNRQDMLNKNRQRLTVGELHGSSILTEAQVLEIKERLKAQMQTSLAKEYGVGLTTIYDIAHGKTWKHLWI